MQDLHSASQHSETGREVGETNGGVGMVNFVEYMNGCLLFFLRDSLVSFS